VSLRLSRLLDLSPISVAAALAAGAANGAAFALAPIYTLGIGVKPSAAPLFTVAIVFGSAVGVYPAGWLSDRIDRRVIMALVMTAGAAFEVALASLEPVGVPLAALGFCVGLATYTLYTLAVSLANDRAKTVEMVLVSAGLLFVYCLGAITAPPLASLAMRAFGSSAERGSARANRCGGESGMLARSCAKGECRVGKLGSAGEADARHASRADFSKRNRRLIRSLGSLWQRQRSGVALPPCQSPTMNDKWPTRHYSRASCQRCETASVG
jgi:hypothetical protein